MRLLAARRPKPKRWRDVPNGRLAYVIGNIMQKGPRTDNSTVVSYGAEGLSHPVNALFVVNNTMVTDHRQRRPLHFRGCGFPARHPARDGVMPPEAAPLQMTDYGRLQMVRSHQRYPIRDVPGRDRCLTAGWQAVEEEPEHPSTSSW